MSQFGIPLTKYFPLRTFPQDTLETLCRSLWGWKNCPQCVNTGVSSNAKCPRCPWSMQPHLEPFRLFYREITYQYTPEDRCKSPPVLENHVALLKIAAFIQHHPQYPRKQLIAEHFGNHGIMDMTDANKNQAFDLALSVLSMIPFAENNVCLDRNPVDGPETWAEHQAASDVVASALPVGEPLSRQERRTVCQNVSAANLEQYNLRIIKTDDFRQHLEYDSAESGVYVFFHPGFLIGHLSSLRSLAVADDRIVLAPQVVLETLYTLRYILFAWEDSRNSSIASNMGFNLDDLKMDMSNYSGLSLDSKQYQYWGKRLLLLVDILEDAKLRRRMQACAKRYRRKAYAGVVVLTLVVGVISAVIGPWMQSREGTSNVVLVMAPNGTVTP
ncbi:hypothetical protein B5807_10525 [Epicoccum nigrum]|uniref:Uncharacterized protein n=1 Tax=Epicoccum nigrum TaxID=105696 RepID=A0A1Y2LKY2_EPING|nr:hypothetical protein B5807_10525 [Epicoccum nigrum]